MTAFPLRYRRLSPFLRLAEERQDHTGAISRMLSEWGMRRMHNWERKWELGVRGFYVSSFFHLLHIDIALTQAWLIHEFHLYQFISRSTIACSR